MLRICVEDALYMDNKVEENLRREEETSSVMSCYEEKELAEARRKIEQIKIGERLRAATREVVVKIIEEVYEEFEVVDGVQDFVEYWDADEEERCNYRITKSHHISPEWSRVENFVFKSGNTVAIFSNRERMFVKEENVKSLYKDGFYGYMVSTEDSVMLLKRDNH
jgi:hypothetical protein